MKFLGFIMAFLVLGLSFLHCADNEPTMNAGKIKTEISQGNQPHDDHEDACSPFCQCACCASLSINHSIATISYDINYSNSIYFSFLSSEIIERSRPIWQPPKL